MSDPKKDGGKKPVDKKNNNKSSKKTNKLSKQQRKLANKKKQKKFLESKKDTPAYNTFLNRVKDSERKDSSSTTRSSDSISEALTETTNTRSSEGPTTSKAAFKALMQVKLDAEEGTPDTADSPQPGTSLKIGKKQLKMNKKQSKALKKKLEALAIKDKKEKEKQEKEKKKKLKPKEVYNTEYTTEESSKTEETYIELDSDN